MSLPFGLKPLFLGGVAAVGMGLLLHIVGTATKYWSYVTTSKVDMSFGLLQYCDTDACKDYTKLDGTMYETPPEQRASAAMAIIGVILAVFAVLVAGVVAVKPISEMLVKVSGGLSLAAFLTTIIAVIIWGAKANDEITKIFKMILQPYLIDIDVEIGFSLGLSAAGAVLLLIGGICMMLTRSRNTT